MKKTNSTLIKAFQLTTCAFAVMSGTLRGAEVSAADTNRWESSAAAGLTLTRGNSDTLLGTVDIRSSRKWPRDEVFLGAGAAYGETDDTKTTQSAAAFGQYNHLFTERWYAGVRLDLLHDEIADLDYRATLSPMIGYYIIKNPRTRLAVEAGPSFIYEKQGGRSTGYIAARLAERFEYKISETTKLWQSLEFIPQVDNFDNYLRIFEIGVEAAMTKKLSLRTYLQNYYDNEPAPGRKKNDTKLVAAVAYKF